MVKKIIVTGGAGFIGSHLAESLAKNNTKITVLDDLSIGTRKNFNTVPYGKKIILKKCDIVSKLPSDYFTDYSTIFHLAAKSDVKESMKNPDEYLRNNISATINILEMMRKKDVQRIIFTSSSTVYGQSARINKENSPTKPISVYGVTKLLCEKWIESYCRTYGFKGIILRLANIIGSRSRKGITHDIIEKFQKNPKKLTVLGDGNQLKSYLYISDCINAMIKCYKRIDKQANPCEIYNISNSDSIKVKDIVYCIAAEMGLKNFKIVYDKYDKEGRGWGGDVTISRLDISKLKSLGWKPKYDCKDAIRLTTAEILNAN